MLLITNVLACGTPVEHSKVEGCFRLIRVALLSSWLHLLTILMGPTKWCMCFTEKFMQHLWGILSTIGLLLVIIFHNQTFASRCGSLSFVGCPFISDRCYL